MTTRLALLVAVLSLPGAARAAFWSCPTPASAPQLSLGTDLVTWDSRFPVPSPPDDLSLDVTAGWDLGRCLVLGARVYVYRDGWDAGAAGEGGVQLQTRLLATFGAEVRLWGWLHGALLAEPGVRLVTNRQYVSYPDQDVDAVYNVTQAIPTLYGHVVLRAFPTQHFGVHLDFAFPTIFWSRETGWFQNRMLGAGFDWRW